MGCRKKSRQDTFEVEVEVEDGNYIESSLMTPPHGFMKGNKQEFSQFKGNRDEIDQKYEFRILRNYLI